MDQQHRSAIDVERLNCAGCCDEEIAGKPWSALVHVELAELERRVGAQQWFGGAEVRGVECCPSRRILAGIPVPVAREIEALSTVLRIGREPSRTHEELPCTRRLAGQRCLLAKFGERQRSLLVGPEGAGSQMFGAVGEVSGLCQHRRNGMMQRATLDRGDAGDSDGSLCRIDKHHPVVDELKHAFGFQLGQHSWVDAKLCKCGTYDTDLTGLVHSDSCKPASAMLECRNDNMVVGNSSLPIDSATLAMRAAFVGEHRSASSRAPQHEGRQ